MKTFKNIILVLGVIVCSAAVVSCQKDSSGISSQVKQIGDKLYWFTPTFEEDCTKAFADMANSASQEGCPVSWEDGDEVFVLNGHDALKFRYNKGNHKFVSEGGPNASTPGMGITWKENCGYVVVYPASIYVSQVYSGGTNLFVNVNLPSVQTFKDNGSCNKPPMMANITAAQMQNPYTTNTTVTFRNLCGILGFSITGDNDKGNYSSISFTGKAACGAGSFTAHPTNTPVLTMSETGNQTVTMTLNRSNVEGTATNYYMYLPPATYSSPTVAVNFAGGGSSVDRVAGSLQIERSKYAVAANYFQTLFSGGGDVGAGTGTASNPYLIRNGNDLIELAAKVNQTNATYVTSASGSSVQEEESTPGVTLSKSGTSYDTSGKFYKLVADINMSSYNANFAPIGSDSSHPFRGTFDGNGHTITGLTLSKSTAIVGLFGYVNGGTVKNLTLTNTSITSTVAEGSDAKAGAFVGQMVGGATLQNCKISGTLSVTLAGNGGGGFVGMITASTINNCDYVSTTGTPAINGSTTATRIGGVVGAVYSDGSTPPLPSTVTGCGAFANVTGKQYVGGVAGIIGTNGAGEPSVISSCNFATEATNRTVTAANGCAGGILGQFTSGGTVQNCVAWGRVVTNAGGNCTGGIVGYAAASDASAVNTISNCQFHSSSTAATTRFVNSDGNYVGGIVGCFAGAGEISGCTADGGHYVRTTGSGKGKVGGIAGEIRHSAVVRNCTSAISVRCPDDGDCAGGIVGNIGSTSSAVAAWITGCTVNNASQTIRANRHIGGIVGFIHSTAGTAVNNSVVKAGVTIRSAVTTSSGSGSWRDKNSCVGGIAGTQWGTTDIENCCTKGCTVYGFAGIGGISGSIYGHGDDYPYINKCSSMANLSSDDTYINRVGGIAGYCDNKGVIRNCVRCGGTITCDYNAEGTGEAGVGGILGQEQNGDAWDDKKGSTAYIQNCQVNSTEVVLKSGSTGGVGGLVGIVTGNYSTDTGTVSTCQSFNCYVVMGNSSAAWTFRVRVGSNYISNTPSSGGFASYYIGPIFGRNTLGKHTIKRCFWGTNYLPGNLSVSGKVTVKDIYDGVTTGDGGIGTGSGTVAYRTAYADYGSGKTYLPTLTRSYSTARTIVAHLNYATDDNPMPTSATQWSTSNAYGGTNGSGQYLASPNGVKY